MRDRYGGTRLGRQELDGEMIDDREDALWSRAMMEAARCAKPGARPHRGGGRSAGKVAQGVRRLRYRRRRVGGRGQGYRAGRCQPARRAAAGLGGRGGRRCSTRLEADCIVAEVNQGGDMVTAVIRAADASVPVRAVRAKRGKWTRAEPVAMLYQQGKVRHAGRFAALEDEMCDFGADGLSGGRSPDRVDALVWAVTELMLGERRAEGCWGKSIEASSLWEGSRSKRVG